MRSAARSGAVYYDTVALATRVRKNRKPRFRFLARVGGASGGVARPTDARRALRGADYRQRVPEKRAGGSVATLGAAAYVWILSAL